MGQLCVGLVMGAGCELVVDLQGLDDKQCKANEKPCPEEKRCARIDDPKSGCGDRDTCAPCVLSHAIATCADGVCAVETCVGDYRHCPGLAAGCETDLAHDPKNCNECGRQCLTPHGYPGCSMRQCATGGCFDGYADCDGDPENGCETEGDCPFSLAP